MQNFSAFFRPSIDRLRELKFIINYILVKPGRTLDSTHDGGKDILKWRHLLRGLLTRFNRSQNLFKRDPVIFASDCVGERV